MCAVLVAAAVGTCFPQEVPGLANIEILKIVPRRISDAAEPLPPLTPTASDRRYDVMIDYDDDHHYEDDSQYEAATTLEQPEPLFTSDFSDYDLNLFRSDQRRESKSKNTLATESLRTPSGSPNEFRPILQRFVEEEALGSSDGFRSDTREGLIAIIDTEEKFRRKEQERQKLPPRREGRLVPVIGENFDLALKERRVEGTVNPFTVSAEKRFVPGRGDFFLPNKDNRFDLVRNESVIQDSEGTFAEDKDSFSPQHRDVPASAVIIQNLPETDVSAVALVTEGSMQHATIVPPPYNSVPLTTYRRTGAGYLAAPPIRKQPAPYHPNRHDSLSTHEYFNDAQHLRRISPLSASLHELYESQDIQDYRSSRALHLQENFNTSELHGSQGIPQVSSQVSRPTAKKETKPSIKESDNSFQTNRQDRAMSILNPSYARLVAAQQDVKKDRALQLRPPVGSMTQDEVAYYTGLQEEIEKSDLLVDAIRDVRSRDGKSIKNLRRQRKDTDNPKVINTVAPDIQEVKKKFGSHPLYQDLPRDIEYLGVRGAGPLLHRDDYSSEQDEYEKMYLPVRAKSLELREIRQVKEHFHSLVPLKALKNRPFTSPTRRMSKSPVVTTYKPPVLPEYIKHHRLTSVVTKPYYKKETSYTKPRQNTIPPPSRSSRLYSEQQVKLGLPKTRVPPPKTQTTTNLHNPRRSITYPDYQTKHIRHLFYNNTNTLPTSSHRSQRTSRLYRLQEHHQSDVRNHQSRDIKTHRRPTHQSKTPSSVKPLLGRSNPSQADHSLPYSQSDNPYALHPTTMQHPAIKAKLRRKRGPDMEDYIEAKMRFPKYGYDIDPYFSDFPSFGFFESDDDTGT